MPSIISEVKKSGTRHVNVAPKEGDEPIAFEIMERAIIDLAHGMKKLSRSRLSTETIVTLLHDYSKVSKRDIRVILKCLDQLEELFLKKKKQ